MEPYATQHTTTEYNRDAARSSASDLGAVSWNAIFAGATAAAAVSLILLVLGTGLGLSSVSPWARSGVSGITFGLSTILGITLTSMVASALGGYIAGRLRSRWVSTHEDEVYFRDTAHGFLAWALATLATATLLTSVISLLVSNTAQVGAAMAGGAVTGAAATVSASATNNDNAGEKSDGTLLPYFMDTLFRKDMNATNANASDMSAPGGAANTPAANTNNLVENNSVLGDSSASKAELARIFANALATGTLSAEDTRYAGQAVAQHTNLTQQEAEQRVTDIFNRLQTKLREAEIAVKAAADKARKMSAYGSLWLFISLLIGAFVASLAAVYGGRQRDL